MLCRILHSGVPQKCAIIGDVAYESLTLHHRFATALISTYRKPKGDYGSARSRLKSNGNDSAAPQAPTPAVLKFSCVRASRLVLSAAQVNANIVNFPESDVSERDMDRYMDGRTTYRVAVPA